MILSLLFILPLMVPGFYSLEELAAYNGTCSPVDCEGFNINVTFPAHVEIAFKGSTTESEMSLEETVLNIFRNALPYFPQIIAKTVSLSLPAKILLKSVDIALIYLLDQNKQSETALEYKENIRDITDFAFSILRSKMSATKNLMRNLKENMQNGTATEQDMKIAIEIAFTECYELKSLFEDATSTFRKYPLLGAPYLISFSAIYYSVVSVAVSFDKEYYQRGADRIIEELSNLIESYREITIKDRQNLADGYWPLHCQINPWFWPTSCYSPLITDNTPGGPNREILFATTWTLDDARDCYRSAIAIKYDQFFQKLILIVKNSAQKFAPKPLAQSYQQPNSCSYLFFNIKIWYFVAAMNVHYLLLCQ